MLLLLIAGMFAVWHFRHSAVAHLRQWEARWRQPRQQTMVVKPAAPAMPSPAAMAETSPAIQNVAPAKDRDTAVPPPAVASRSPVTSLPAAAPAPQPAVAKDSADPSAAEFVVRLHAREDSWVSIAADGKPVMKGTLIARRETTVRAKQKITLVAGNAAGIEFSFNGKPQGALGGKSKEVRTVNFTPAGLQP